MEINVSVQYNEGLLPDIMLSTRWVVFQKMKRKLSPPEEKNI